MLYINSRKISFNHDCTNLRPRIVKYNPGTRNVTSCVIFRPRGSWDEEEEVSREQVTHLGARSLGSITRVFVKECKEIYCLLKTNLELFPSCKSLTQLCYAALYVMDWLSRVCLCHRQPIREQRWGTLTNQRSRYFSAEVAGSLRPQAEWRNTRRCPHPSSCSVIHSHWVTALASG